MIALAYPDHVFGRTNVAYPSTSTRLYVCAPSAGSADFATNSSAKATFDRLAAAWRDDVQFSSSIADMVMNKHYQRIIGQGIPMVPFLLNDLKRGPEHWYWALAAITGANPAETAPPGDLNSINEAWLDWGRKSGFIR